jgi:hypothetical protein
MFMYLRVDHWVPAMCRSLAAARLRQGHLDLPRLPSSVVVHCPSGEGRRGWRGSLDFSMSTNGCVG